MPCQSDRASGNRGHFRQSARVYASKAPLLALLIAGCGRPELDLGERGGGPADGGARGSQPDAGDSGRSKPDASDGGRSGGGSDDAEIVDGGDEPDADSEEDEEDEGAADAGTDTAAPSDADADVERPTCPPTGTLEPGETKRTILVGDAMRSYTLHVPPSYSGKAHVPLVIDWHPILATGAVERLLSGYADLSDEEGFIAAFPDGIDGAWNLGPCCTYTRDVDDVGFARALVAEVAELACLDRKRVYTTGFAIGGGMAYQLACQAADLFAAAAPAAFDLLVAGEQPCVPARPITVFAFRSRQDPNAPYDGGASMPANGLPVTIHALGAQATFAFWKEANGCTGSPTTSDGCETYSDCQGGVETTLCTADGSGSQMPGYARLGWAALKRFTLP